MRTLDQIREDVEKLVLENLEEIYLLQEEYGKLYLTGFIHAKGEKGRIGVFEFEGNAFDRVIFKIDVYGDESVHTIERIAYEVLSENSIKTYDSYEEWEHACQED